MTYRVIIAKRARAAILEQARYIAVEELAPEATTRWLERIFDASDSLSQLPRRCALASENDLRPYEIRFLAVGSFQLLFTILEEARTVLVISARHGRQLPRPEDLPPTVAG